MTSYAQVVTRLGKNNLLYTGFSGSIGAEPFGFIAAGKGTTDPTEESDSLDAECSSQDGNYSRAQLTTIDFDEQLSRVILEGIFPIENITTDTTINQIGIVNTSTLLQGIFFCICRIPPMTKNGDNQLRVVVTATIESV